MATTKARRKAIRDLQLKLSLEKTFIPELRKYFADQKRRVKSERILESVKPYLKKQYARVVKKLLNITIKQENPFLQDELERYAEERASRQSQFIDDTTEKNLARARKLAIEELEKNNVPYNEAIIASLAAQYFRRLNRARPENIALTETQAVVERMKNIKYNSGADEVRAAIRDIDRSRAIAAAEATDSETLVQAARRVGREHPEVIIASIAVLYKTWQDIGDAKVRPWHREARGQRKLVTEPFVVMGERLMHPGDTSLGASMKNIAHCRCSAVYL